MGIDPAQLKATPRPSSSKSCLNTKLNVLTEKIISQLGIDESKVMETKIVEQNRVKRFNERAYRSLVTAPTTFSRSKSDVSRLRLRLTVNERIQELCPRKFFR